MDILGRAKRKTAVYSAARFDSDAVQYELEPGDEIHIRGRKMNGVHSFYKIDGGDYVFSDDIQLIRDLGFYYDNYKEKNFQKSNINIKGAKGFNYILTPAKAYTSSYDFLQRFSFWEDAGFGTIDTSSSFVSENTGGIRSGDSVFNGSIIKSPPYMGGGNSPVSDVENQSLSNTLGINDSMGLLNDISIGNLFDGSFMDTLGDNILNAINNWASSKMAYVVGFDFASGKGWLSTIFDLFNGKAGRLSLFDSLFRMGLTNVMGNAASAGYSNNNNSMIDAPFARGLGVAKLFKYADVASAVYQYFSYYDYIPDNSDPFYFENASQLLNSYTLFDSLNTGIVNNVNATSIERTKFLTRLMDADYSAEKTLLDEVKIDLNISVDRATRFNKFNRWRIPSVDHELGNTKGYIFFSVPDMNLTMPKTDIETGSTIYYDYIGPLMNVMLSQHPTMMKYLTGGGGGHKFIPVFTDRCTGLDMQDDVLETMEAHQSLTGWKIIYGKGNIQSRTASTVTVAFQDDNMLSIYKMLKVWTEYINAVYRGTARPKEKYYTKHILDYAISIYYFLTDQTGEDILFFSKYTGCFPTAAPSSNFSDTLDSPIKLPTYSVPFSYAKKDDYNPLNLAEFNHLSAELGFSGIAVAGQDDYLAHRTFVGAPFVDTETGGYLYKIKFRQP